MPPTKINVEAEFTKFVQSFQFGSSLTDFMDNIPNGVLNADYYFPEHNVIAELKTLEIDALDIEKLNRRIMASYKWLGYDLIDYVNFLDGNEYMPEDVNKRVFSTASRPIIECVKKANKQIISTKNLLGRNDAEGLILIANSGNLGFQASQIMGILLKAYEQLKLNERSAIVYFTPNVFHDLGDETAYEIWVPIANERGEKLQDFIDTLGRKWFDYGEKIRPSKGLRKEGSSTTDTLRLLGSSIIHDWSD